MTIKQRKLNMLGLAMRAGKLISGTELVIKAIKKNKVDLIVCASDASLSTRKELEHLALSYKIPIELSLLTDEISAAIGKARRICALTDQGMTKKYLSYNEMGEAHMEE